MRVFAIHDAVGVISEIVTAPDTGPSAGIVPRAGWSMTEVNMPAGIQIADSVEENQEQLADLVQQYRVIVEPRKARLERQDEGLSVRTS